MFRNDLNLHICSITMQEKKYHIHMNLTPLPRNPKFSELHSHMEEKSHVEIIVMKLEFNGESLPPTPPPPSAR